MKKILLKIVIISILCILTLYIKAFASYDLTLETTTNGRVFSIGSTITATVDWGEEMQAVGFELLYDSTKLEFIEATISEDFYNIIALTDEGDPYSEIKIQWASLDNNKLTNISFKFKAIAKGDANISISDVSAFANENLERPEQIDFRTNGTKSIKINTLGDIDLNGKVNIRDSALLLRYLLGWTGELYELNEEQLANADVCTDGEINQLDSDILKKYTAGWAVSFPFIYGDANCDGVVNTMDRLAIARHLDEDEFKDYTLSNEGLNRADVNLDNQVDDKDRVILQRYCAKWAGYEKLPIQFTSDNSLKFLNYDDNRFIYGFDDKKMKVSELVSKFNNGLVVLVFNQNGQKLTDNDYVGTGMTIKIGLKNKDEITDEEAEELAGDIGEYTVLLYGDTTGDGRINAIDALALIKDINNKIPFTNEVYRQAGKVVSFANISTSDPKRIEATAVDALAIIKYVNGKYDINQEKY